MAQTATTLIMADHARIMPLALRQVRPTHRTCMTRPHAVIFAVALLAAALPLPAFAAPAPAAPRAATKPPVSQRQKVTLTAQPGTAADADARQAVARDLAEARRVGDRPLLRVGSAALGGPNERPALFVQIQSARECGSAGCNTSVHLFRQGRWQRVVDTVSGPIVVDALRHGGMRDLIVNGRDRWIWNGRAYVDSRPAPPPPASLRRRQVPKARTATAPG